MTEPTAPERAVHGAARTVFIGLAAVLALSTFYVAPKLADRVVGVKQSGGPVPGGSAATTADPAAGGGDGAVNGGTTTNGGGGQGGVGAKPGAASGLSCSANNGGKTDVGIDDHTINLAGTEVESGIGQSFLGPVHYGIQAVLQKVNRQGGVCRRQIRLTLKDDGWDPRLGKQFLDNFIQSNQYFALAVVPSSNGLDAASSGKDIDNAGIPVMGTDGMLNSQYSDPWIWPVAASTATSMRIMARDAVNRGKSLGRPIRMGIVFDANYPFGPEGAGAFVNQAKRDGGSVEQSCQIALQAGQNGYGTQAKQFNDACGENAGDHRVDFVALLLEPQTAETWLRENPYLGQTSSGAGLGFGGPQPLFDKNFGDTCGPTCANMQVWTSFFPPISPYDQRPEVQQFKQDLCAVDNQCEADSLSAFTEGGYVGMQLVVAALTKASPQLTRGGVRGALDSMSLQTGLAATLTWKQGYHYANQSMVAFRDTYSGGSSSFQYVVGSDAQDPCPGCHDNALG
jgi:ABC-type branched-subunit amino acid transport system substrate-binding protein